MFTWQHYTKSLDMWSVGCIVAELILRAYSKVTFTDKNSTKYYALFPAQVHRASILFSPVRLFTANELCTFRS